MANNRYDLKKLNNEVEDMDLLYISRSKYENDWNNYVHSHNFVEIFYILSGEGYFNLRGKKHNVYESDIVIINPNTYHAEVSTTNKPLEYIVFAIEGLSFEFAKYNGLETDAVVRNNELSSMILEYLEMLLHEVSLGIENDLRVSICNHLTNIIVLQMLLSSNDLKVKKYEDSETVECATVKRYIDKHFTEKISLEQLSKIGHINKYYLAHSFKKIYGISVINYLNNKKLEHCKELLITTDYTVLQVSETCNFSSQSYFSQIFKKAYGQSPSNYKKNNV